MYLILVVKDRALAHISHLTKSAQLKLGITSLTHPLSSPDLNSIKLLWLMLKNCIVDTLGASNSFRPQQQKEGSMEEGEKVR